MVDHTAGASALRTDYLMQPSFNVLGLSIEAAESVGAANNIEKMLANQIAVAHEGALRMMDRGLSYEHGQSGTRLRRADA